MRTNDQILRPVLENAFFAQRLAECHLLPHSAVSELNQLDLKENVNEGEMDIDIDKKRKREEVEKKRHLEKNMMKHLQQ